MISEFHNRDETWQCKDLNDVMLDTANLWINDYKFMKLQIDENWGGRNNMFYSLSVLGVTYESRSDCST